MISNNHHVNKESLWRQWIEPNQDILEILFHYTDREKIRSPWIQEHCLPKEYTVPTSYYHMVPAYMNLLFYAHAKIPGAQWFCMLTESCIPFVSPAQFRTLFLGNHGKSLFHWKPCWWNVDFPKRANLRLLPPEYRLAHDPYFVLSRRHVETMHRFYKVKRGVFDRICAGGLANESLFAIALKTMGQLEEVVNVASTATDWSRMSSTTSPHVFQYGDAQDRTFIKQTRENNPWAIFMRKVVSEFPMTDF